MQTRLLLLLLALAACPTGAGALSTDREQSVRIDANSASLDDQKRIATYKGEVVIVQGSLRITGDLVTMYFDERYDLARLVAEGEPARFEQRLEDGQVQKGRAERIEYQVEDGAMLFVGGAQIAQGEFRMKADRIDYDSVTGSIQGAGEEDRRVTITLRGGKK
jgi:lipopolysaccharide export system protein LptA